MSIGQYISPRLSVLLAPGQFSLLAGRYPMAAMKTIEEIRHANLMLILAEMADQDGERGAIQRLASAMGRSHSHVSQLKTRAPHSNTKKARNIGPAMARLIEKAAQKERGWLDAEHTGAAAITSQMLAAAVQAEFDRRLGPESGNRKAV